MYNGDESINFVSNLQLLQFDSRKKSYQTKRKTDSTCFLNRRADVGDRFNQAQSCQITSGDFETLGSIENMKLFCIIEKKRLC